MKSALNDLAAVAVAAVALCATTMLYGQTQAVPQTEYVPSAQNTSKPADTNAAEKPETTDLHLIELKYADAGNLAELLTNVLGPGSSRKGTPIGIIPDRRTNQLIITATKSDFEAIEALALKLDVPAPQRQTGSEEPSTESRLPSTSPRRGVTSSGRSATPGGRGRGILSAGGGSTDGNATSAESEKSEPAATEVRVFQIKYADVADLGDVLRQALDQVFAKPGARLVWNKKGPQGSDLIVNVPKDDMPKIEMLIKRLDTPSTAQNNVIANDFQPYSKPWADFNVVTDGGFGRGGFSGTTSEFGGTATAGSGGGSGWQVSDPLNAAVNYLKNSREVDGAAKQAEASAKEMAELLKQAEASAKAGKSDAVTQLLERIDHLAAEQRKAADQQRRSAEDAKRKAEAQFRDYQKALELNPSLAKSPGSGMWDMPRDQEAAKLDAQIKQLVERAHSIAALTGTTPEQKKERELGEDNVKEQLRELLNEQFKQREKSQSSELEQLRQRLDKLEKELSDRKSNRESLIDRRLNELLSDNSTAEPKMKTRGTLVFTDGDPTPKLGVLSTDGQSVIVDGEIIKPDRAPENYGNPAAPAKPAPPAPPARPLSPSTDPFGPS